MAQDKRRKGYGDINDIPMDADNLTPDEIEALQDYMDGLDGR
ncbi:MAG: hypothetical protein JWM37_54 [Candidatus Saccharibacteria bacterium]|nr:hypothetical protein [Candidatus Saccharibacteria bacterium]